MRTPHKINYIVKEEERMVIAIMKGCETDALEKFAGNVQTVMLCNPKAVLQGNRFVMPGTFKGIAICHPSDEFDKEEGKKIAKERLMKKYNHSLKRHVLNLKEFYIDWLQNSFKWME